ncbi:unnamed protein product [marine sediment metagenome]|uniref:Uncharacterized protein n=1 Tax=marine sediment metagenome TaxID=412755 RepID=X0XW77_9ZZZZ
MEIKKLTIQTTDKDKRKAYFVMESQRDLNNNELIVCIAVEGETGYYKTDWRWGENIDEAEAIARGKNELMGISSEESCKIVLSSMRKGAVETPRF